MARPKKDNCSYFSHDANMRNHRKIKALRTKFGINGYAMWCMLLEFLTEAHGNKIENTVLEMELIAGDIGVSVTEINDFVSYCVSIDLLILDNGFFRSESLDERLSSVYEKRERSRVFAAKQHREDGKFKENNTAINGVSVTEKPQTKLNKTKVNNNIKNNTKSDSGKSDLDFHASILEIIRSVKSEFLHAPVRPYKITPKRVKMISNRKKDFDKLWPGRDFHKACNFAFVYKAKDWVGTDMFKFFEPETLLSEKFASYLEKAEQDKGEPYRAEIKSKEEPVAYKIPQ